MVTVLAGKDETPFVLHRTPLFRKSSYFRKGLASDQDADDMKPANLPEIEVRRFKVYTHWVYSSQLNIAVLECRVTTGQRPVVSVPRHASEAERTYRRVAPLDNGDLISDLMRLWADGDFLGDVGFQNIVSDELVEWLLVKENCLTLIPTTTFAFVNDNTNSECPLRQILIDWADLALTTDCDMEVFTAVAPKWLVAGLLLSKVSREDREWKYDLRDEPTRERYHIRQVADM